MDPLAIFLIGVLVGVVVIPKLFPPEGGGGRNKGRVLPP
jgi:hypothetical protein